MGKKALTGSFDPGELPAAFLDRVSAFETLRSYEGMIFHAYEHVERLYESCRGMGESLPLPPAELLSWLSEALQESGLPDSMIRLSVHWPDAGEGRIVAMIREFRAYPEEIYKKGVELLTCAPKRWTLKAQDSQVKASQFVTGVMAHLDSGENVPREFLLMGHAGTVAEGTVSNIFIVKEKRLLTPCVASGILRGVTRGIVLEIAGKLGFDARETFLTRHEIYSADECFMTNTSSEVLPVVRVDRRDIGAGHPGPATKKLAENFKAGVRKALLEK